MPLRVLLFTACCPIAIAADPPAAAPAGKIAFVRKGQVTIMNTDGTGLIHVADVIYDRPLTWNSSGSRLFFWKHSATGWDIWACDAEGKNQRNLTNTATGGSRSGIASPDDKLIAHMRDEPEGLYVMQADGTGQRKLAGKVDRDAAPSWSPDGKQIVWSDGHGSINIIDTDGRNAGVLTKDGRDPVWSSDPNKILFTQGRGMPFDLSLIDPADRKITRLTNSPDNETHAVWSPDARHIAFHATTPKGRTELRVMDADGKNVHTLTKLEGRVEKEFTWSPDSAWLTWVSGDGPARSLYIAPVTGGAPRKLTGEGAHYPVWQPKR